MHQRDIILGRLSETNYRDADHYLRAARETLDNLRALPSLLSGVELSRTPRAYTRNLIFGGKELSAWALVWTPGSLTPIHDHHCSCCFAVLRGTIRESWYSSIDPGRAVKTAEHFRTKGYVAAMKPTGPNIHQMTNDGPEDAVTLHIYGYDHREHDTSILNEYDLANG